MMDQPGQSQGSYNSYPRHSGNKGYPCTAFARAWTADAEVFGTIILADTCGIDMKTWRVGCSGFYYKHWKEKFYPKGLPQRRWFEFYCETFDTVELNVTFYRYPKLEALQGWYARSPEDFSFTVKAPRLITHYKKFHNALRETHDFYELVQKGLGEKLGCVLFQMPPNMVYAEATLENILSTLDPGFSNVIEFRHQSWWRSDVFQTLKEKNITFCGISYPGLPETVIRSVPVAYYRFHGVPEVYASPYSVQKLKQVAAELSAFRGVAEVYAYFNNDIHAEAISNARQLKEIVKGAHLVAMS